MKNATKHAETLKTLHRRLLKDAKVNPIEPLAPLRALVVGAMSYDVPDAKVAEAMAAADAEFVDLNELRVATELELEAILGPKYPDIKHRLSLMLHMLNFIFEKEHTLSFDRVKTLNKKDMRTFVRELPEMTPFIEGYLMLYGFESPAVPVDETMLGYLREHEVVEEKTTAEEAQKFLESHLKVEQYVELFTLCRAASMEKKKAK